MPDVLIFADSVRSPELRHEVPLAVPDTFLYAEHGGERHVVVASFELDRIKELGGDLQLHPFEELGLDDLYEQGLSREQLDLELNLAAARRFGIERAVVPADFPLELADYLRANGIDLTPDRDFFVARRRVKNEDELAGIKRAQQGAEAGMAVVRDMLRRADRSDGTLTLDGDPLTCERIHVAVEQAFSEHGVAAEDFIVSHGAQTAVGHDTGSGPIAPGEPVLADLFPRDRESGCYTDMTRTFVAPGADDATAAELREYQRLCRDALERVLEAVRPGASGRDLHRIACDIFHEHGYPTQLSKKPGEVLESGFYHGLGHGVGLEVHEQPWLSRAPGELVAGDVIATKRAPSCSAYRNGSGIETGTSCRISADLIVSA